MTLLLATPPVSWSLVPRAGKSWPWLLSTQAVTMGLLGRTAPPHEEQIFPPPQSGVRAPLTLRTEGEYFKNICHSYSTENLFSHSCCWLPSPTPICCLRPRAILLSLPAQPKSEASRMSPTQRQKEFNRICATRKETGQSLD